MKTIYKTFSYVFLVALMTMLASFALAYEPIVCTADVIGNGMYTMTNAEDEADAQSIIVNGHGTFTCSFSEPGDYVYRITSEQESEDEVYWATYSVFQDGDSLGVNAAIKRMSDEAKVDAVDYIGLTDSVPVYSSVLNEPENADAIQFKLAPQSPDDPMPSGSENGSKTVEIAGSGSVDFGDLHFTTPGVYEYTVTVVDDGNSDFEYDDAIYAVRIIVSRQDDGILTSVKEFYKDWQLLANASRIDIANTYVGGGQEEDSDAEYYFDNGSDKTWTKGSTNSFDVTVHKTKDDESTFEHFRQLYVDGVLVDKTDYTAASGSLKASFAPSYMETLNTGVHLLKAEFNDGTATHSFTIAAKQSDTNDNGENGNENGNNASGNHNSNGSSNGQASNTENNTTESSQVHGKTGDSYSVFKYAILLIFGILSFGVLLIANKGSERGGRKHND